MPLDWGVEEGHDIGRFVHFLAGRAFLAYLDPLGNRVVRERKRATLKTISEETGFALTTVSRALKNESAISAETRQTVQAAAKRLGYRPDRAAQGLRTGRTLVIGLILDERLAVAEFERRIITGCLSSFSGRSFLPNETNFKRSR